MVYGCFFYEPYAQNSHSGDIHVEWRPSDGVKKRIVTVTPKTSVCVKLSRIICR